jgi:hypothetical protein
MWQRSIGIVITLGLACVVTACGTPLGSSPPASTSYTPPAPVTTPHPALPIVPSPQMIATVMAHTYPVGTQDIGLPQDGFFPTSAPVTVPDGTGGWLTAVVGSWRGSADGGGQAVFFWHNTQFVGWSDPRMVLFPQVRAAGSSILISYPEWPPGEGFAQWTDHLDSAPQVLIQYTWSNGRVWTNPWNAVPPNTDTAPALEYLP